MREAYLTGGNEHFDATDVAEISAESIAPVYILESVALTEEGRLKIVGNRYFGEASEEFAITRSRAPHPDLLKELRRLTLHMALLTESVSDDQLYPTHAGLATDALYSRLQLREGVETGEAFLHPKLEPFRCLAVAWKSKGVVLSGERKSRYRFNKALPLKTAETLILGSLDESELEEDDYPFFEQLSNTLASLQSECISYLNGKYGEGGEQLELFGKDPEPRSVGDIANELLGALDNDRYTVSVGTPGGEMREVGGRKRKARRIADRKSGKDAAAGPDA